MNEYNENEEEAINRWLEKYSRELNRRPQNVGFPLKGFINQPRPTKIETVEWSWRNRGMSVKVLLRQQ